VSSFPLEGRGRHTSRPEDAHRDELIGCSTLCLFRIHDPVLHRGTRPDQRAGVPLDHVQLLVVRRRVLRLDRLAELEQSTSG
jgi:hypothetical protein